MLIVLINRPQFKYQDPPPRVATLILLGGLNLSAGFVIFLYDEICSSLVMSVNFLRYLVFSPDICFFPYRKEIVEASQTVARYCTDNLPTNITPSLCLTNRK